ncbi:HEAT repeat domain-containing protein [Lacipirellula limnantheis]|uniref:HEAT repeat protein n=1 Tax=Lacipirellula limnantheis TaxID=2528024 RepID=A0A517TX41_9BACT|nr:HEAT repeat domain-containing protein [Lacipirellula limnantheis]QDT72932.1 hypothetical protein I41_21170 [Lacipirellula limnantheis]
MTKRYNPGNRPLISRWVVGGAAVGWMTAAACGVWYEIGDRQRAHVAAALADRALTRSGRSLDAAIAELERLGAAGIEPLVGLAASQRSDVASAAQHAVGRMLTTWELEATESGDVKAFALRAVSLASALDARGDQFGAEGQRWANELARKLLVHSDQFSTSESWEILACCDHVLGRPLLPLKKTTIVAADLNDKPPGVAAPEPVSAPLPVQHDPPPDLPPSVRRTPRPLADITFVESPMPLAVVRRIPEHSHNGLRPPLRLPDDGASPPASATNVGPVIDVPSPQEVRLSARALRDFTDRSLVTKAAEGVGAEAIAARQALRERGFVDGVLEFIEQVESLAPPARRGAIERAAQLPPADARQVLRWFVADEDAEVRLQALTILATTGDPKLAELARERAVEDVDPRVAEFASKLIRSR